MNEYARGQHHQELQAELELHMCTAHWCHRQSWARGSVSDLHEASSPRPPFARKLGNNSVLLKGSQQFWLNSQKAQSKRILENHGNRKHSLQLHCSVGFIQKRGHTKLLWHCSQTFKDMTECLHPLAWEGPWHRRCKRPRPVPGWTLQFTWGKLYSPLGTRIRFRAAQTSGSKLGVEDGEQWKQCWLFLKQL